MRNALRPAFGAMTRFRYVEMHGGLPVLMRLWMESARVSTLIAFLLLTMHTIPQLSLLVLPATFLPYVQRCDWVTPLAYRIWSPMLVQR